MLEVGGPEAQQVSLVALAGCPAFQVWVEQGELLAIIEGAQAVEVDQSSLLAKCDTSSISCFAYIDNRTSINKTLVLLSSLYKS